MMMNKIIIGLSLVTIASCTNIEHKEKAKDFNSYGPAENLWERWTYPNDKFDQKYFNKVIASSNVIAANKDQQTDLNWRMEGPLNIGGRINCISLNPDDESEIWIGTSAGGVFRSSDAGQSWEELGNDFAYMSIGSIAFDNSNTDIVYVGTGDPNISGYPHAGNGVYKTMDGGATWEHKGPSEVGIVSKLLVDPSSSDVIYMAAMGTPWEEGPNRGVYKSIDGGDTWDQVLFLSNQAGLSSLVFHPNTPDTLYAAGWDRIRSNTQSIVEGNHSRIYRSMDAGDTWETLEGGLPQEIMSRAAVDVSISDPSVLYASFVNEDMQFYGVYKSTNYGDTWTATNIANLDGALGGFGWYFGMIRINPEDENDVSVAGVELHSTGNGGDSWFQSTPDWWTYEVHADMHDLVYASNGDIYLGTDGGLFFSDDNMNSWEYLSNIPNTQFYRISVDPHNDQIYSGGAQDNGTTAGNYTDLDGWPRLYGGDGFQSLYNPDNENIFYASTQNGNFNKQENGFWDNFNFGINDNEHVAWDAPLIMSSHDYDVLFTATAKVYKHNGNSWYAVSDDLNASEEFYPANRHVVSTVTESPITADLLYAGTSDGKVWYSEDVETDIWEDITTGLPDRYVTNIKASSFEENRVYVSHSGYKDGDNSAHIHRSDDNGQTWIAINGDLPDFGINHIEILDNHEDSILFIACDGGVYFTTNSGDNWNRVGDNMPTILVFDIEIDYDANRLVAGTFSRSIQSLSLDSLLDISTGIFENQLTSFKLFPNPTVDELTIDYPSSIQNSNWEIRNINGEIVKQGNLNSRKIDVNNLSSGLYFFMLNVNQKIEVKKWIKK
jgi:photosystem II stability/assembly factor-like uncharacterized protein